MVGKMVARRWGEINWRFGEREGVFGQDDRMDRIADGMEEGVNKGWKCGGFRLR
jgi:hypothetical protein